MQGGPTKKPRNLLKAIQSLVERKRKEPIELGRSHLGTGESLQQAQLDGIKRQSWPFVKEGGTNPLYRREIKIP